MDFHHDGGAIVKPTSDSTWSLTARWILPMGRKPLGSPCPPLADGVIHIDGDRVVRVEKKGCGKADVDLGDVAVLPGFVNAHTHLDLTGLAGQCPPTANFTDWLRAVIAHRRTRTPDQIEQDLRDGLQQCIRHGTTLLADISAGGHSWPIVSESPIRAVVFYELLGLTEERAEQSWQRFQDWLLRHPATATCRPGVSPHAPYSVRESLFQQVATLPDTVPVAVHVAETQAEIELLEHRRGPFVEFLKELGVWDADGLVKSIARLLNILNKRQALLIHGNYLGSQTKHPDRHAVVYCPRTHAAFGHGTYPWQSLHEQGTMFGFGTDSLASNPGLDLLGELRHLDGQFTTVSAQELLYRATVVNAGLLGWGHEVGYLDVGMSADLVAVSLAGVDDADPYSSVLATTAGVSKVMCRGQWIFEA